jgi:hypothetical protein
MVEDDTLDDFLPTQQLLFEEQEQEEPPLTLPYSPFISYTPIDPPGLNSYGCLIHMNYSSPDDETDLPNTSTPQEDHQLYLHELWKNYSLLIIKGDKPLTGFNELKICRLYQEKIAKEANLTDEYSPARYEELSSQYKQLQADYYSSQNELKDAKLTITHQQDDLLHEKQKYHTLFEQLSTFHELEEYSAGLRDECSDLEETISELKMKLQDFERSSTVLNLLNHDLQTEKNKLLKEITEKDLKIESLEKELWCRHLKVSSSPEVSTHPIGGGAGSKRFIVPTLPLKNLSPRNGNGSARGLGAYGRNDSEGSDLDRHVTPLASPSRSQSARSVSSSPGLISPSQPNTQFFESSNHHPHPHPHLHDTNPTDSPRQPVFIAEETAETVIVTEDPLAPNLSRMMQEMEESNRRLVSRLKFLDSRLEIKEEALKKLGSRIEVCLSLFLILSITCSHCSSTLSRR